MTENEVIGRSSSGPTEILRQNEVAVVDEDDGEWRRAFD